MSKFLLDYIKRQKAWSIKTFGEGIRTGGITKHIEKELDEIRAAPKDLMEWIDVIILGLDGAWRSGHDPLEIVAALNEKQKINFGRKYPNPKGDEWPVEHIRDGEEFTISEGNGEILYNGDRI